MKRNDEIILVLLEKELSLLDDEYNVICALDEDGDLTPFDFELSLHDNHYMHTL
jgi:hypothetical protein